MAADAAEAVRKASSLVAQAISELTAVGPDAPVAVREALTSLGSSFTQLGYVDPAVSWGIPRESDR
jgi:hypothetical protein